MTQQARAVICREVGKPVVVESVSVDAPRHGEIAFDVDELDADVHDALPEK